MQIVPNSMDYFKGNEAFLKKNSHCKVKLWDAWNIMYLCEDILWTKLILHHVDVPYRGENPTLNGHFSFIFFLFPHITVTFSTTCFYTDGQEAIPWLHFLNKMYFLSHGLFVYRVSAYVDLCSCHFTAQVIHTSEVDIIVNQIMLRGTRICEPTSMAIHPIVVKTYH